MTSTIPSTTKSNPLDALKVGTFVRLRRNEDAVGKISRQEKKKSLIAFKNGSWGWFPTKHLTAIEEEAYIDAASEFDIKEIKRELTPASSATPTPGPTLLTNDESDFVYFQSPKDATATTIATVTTAAATTMITTTTTEIEVPTTEPTETKKDESVGDTAPALQLPQDIDPMISPIAIVPEETETETAPNIVVEKEEEKETEKEREKEQEKEQEKEKEKEKHKEETLATSQIDDVALSLPLPLSPTKPDVIGNGEQVTTPNSARQTTPKPKSTKLTNAKANSTVLSPTTPSSTKSVGKKNLDQVKQERLEAKIAKMNVSLLESLRLYLQHLYATEKASPTVAFSEKSCQQFFAYLDANKSGRIPFSQFVKKIDKDGNVLKAFQNWQKTGDSRTDREEGSFVDRTKYYVYYAIKICRTCSYDKQNYYISKIIGF
ncbi:PHD zinc finger-containing protein [Reticulomyxa filosa]|uniref:PHD zinc finger-containing protein n=1 Tax=Reticulomyxa filosa TaxID=46433 RepID=X6LFL7_RETFI|nr:PHD zinc finger-containing protein [Reticulomyxa filosa]|eukprot:ETO00788.1 PHD zinc finger-containing protein [Reticulomyxa filosa]